MQMAATAGMVSSPGLGLSPLAQSAATLPGVSAPSSVVRSMQRIARSSAHSFASFLIERLARAAARSSTPTWSTERTPRISEPRWARETETAICSILRHEAVDAGVVDRHPADVGQALAEHVRLRHGEAAAVGVDVDDDRHVPVHAVAGRERAPGEDRAHGRPVAGDEAA